MLLRHAAVVTVAAGLLVAAAPAAQAALPKPVASVEGVTEYRLDNGLRVLLVPEPSQPKVTVAIVYLVGSRMEGYGETGMAHLLEHMVFKGTPTHKEIWAELRQHGAEFNGSTSYDRTEYHETMRATDENMDFALGLEADRMVHSNISGEDLSHEFSVVRNEFEFGENIPVNVLSQRVLSTAFLWHNYGKAVIGSRADIERVPVDNLRAFYKKYYQPDNAVLIVAGKIDSQKTLALVQKRFGGIARPARKLGSSYTIEPVQDGERTVALRRVGGTQLVIVAYHTVAAFDEKYPATQAIAFLLTDQPNGRLYKALVTTGMASSVFGGSQPMAEPGWIQLAAEVPEGKPLEPVRDKMIEIIEGLAKDTPTAEEIEHFKVRSAKNLELAFTEPQAITSLLTSGVAAGDWRLVFLGRDRVEKLTPAQVVEVAGQLFKADNRTVGTFIPTQTPDRSLEPVRPDVAALLKDYKGKEAVAAGEAFDATLENVEKRTTRTTLPGGIKLALLPKKTRGETVRFTLDLHYGTEKDFVGHEEAAGMVGTLLLRGSKKHSYQQLKDELDRLKAQVSFFSDDGDAGVRVTTDRKHLVEVIALVGEIVREPTLPKEEFEVVKKEALTGLERARTEPGPLANRALDRALHPWPADDIRYVPTVEEDLARTKAVTLEDVKRIHQTLWGASNAEVAVVGAFDPDEVKGAIAKAFGDWKSTRPYERIAVPYKDVAPARPKIDTPDKANATVAMGFVIPMRDDDPDYPALYLANYILAQGGNSRLFLRVRQRDGLSYGVGGSLSADPLDKRATFRAGAIANPENVAKARDAMLEEIAKMASEGPTADEVAKAKAAYKAGFATRMANDDMLLGMLARGLFVGRTLEFQQKLNAAIDRLTVDDVKNVLKKGYLKPESLVVVVAGDQKKVPQAALK
jgi:zinc protease